MNVKTLVGKIHRLLPGLLAFFALSAPVQAADLLYVAYGSNKVVTYDVSLSSGSAITASATVFASTNLSMPYGMAFNSAGDLYVANNTGGSVSIFNSQGAYQSSVTSQVNGPNAVAFDAAGNLYVGNGALNGISVYNSSNVYQRTINQASLSNTTALAFDAAGNLYAGSLGGNAIVKFDSSGTYVGNTTTSVNAPRGFYMDQTGSGTLYVSNNGANSVGKYDTSGNYLGALSAVGTPWGIARDSAGNFYVGSQGAQLIFQLSPTGTFKSLFGSSSYGTPLGFAMQSASVPEPSTYLLGVIATGLLAALAKRRRQSRVLA